MSSPGFRSSRPRQADIARLAGVSQAAVSLVINGRVDGISAETRQRVLEVVRAVGYVPNPAARSLAGGRNRLLGVYTFESVFPRDQRDFYYPFLVGIEEEAEAQGYDLVLFTSTFAPGSRRSIYRGGANRLNVADGCVLLGVEQRRDELAQLAAEGYPFVHIGRREVPGADIAYVGADYTTVTEQLTRQLFERGHRRLAYLGEAVRHEPLADRELGFRQAHLDAGRTLARGTVKRGRPSDATPEWLRAELRLGTSAFLVEEIATAEAIADAAVTLGRSIPKDFSVVVLTDQEGARADAPRWTHFAIPRADMGRHAVRLLLEILDHAEPHARARLLPCQQVEGETIGSAP